VACIWAVSLKFITVIGLFRPCVISISFWHAATQGRSLFFHHYHSLLSRHNYLRCVSAPRRAVVIPLFSRSDTGAQSVLPSLQHPPFLPRLPPLRLSTSECSCSSPFCTQRHRGAVCFAITTTPTFPAAITSAASQRLGVQLLFPFFHAATQGRSLFFHHYHTHLSRRDYLRCVSAPRRAYERYI
jgi:hypothetical protein